MLWVSKPNVNGGIYQRAADHQPAMIAQAPINGVPAMALSPTNTRVDP